jgi:hypothetical protein
MSTPRDRALRACVNSISGLTNSDARPSHVTSVPPPIAHRLGATRCSRCDAAGSARSPSQSSSAATAWAGPRIFLEQGALVAAGAQTSEPFTRAGGLHPIAAATSANAAVDRADPKRRRLSGHRDGGARRAGRD